MSISKMFAKFAKFPVVAGVVLLMSGCAFDESAGHDVASMPVEAPATGCTLTWLNDASTTLEVLDAAVGLDARAARALIARRDGSDGRAGTHDDNLFDDSGELEAVKFVGASALERIASASASWCEARPEHAYEGHWHGVSLTQRQAEHVLTVVNVTPVPQLDVLLGGNRVATEAIFLHREIGSLDALAALDGVDRAALVRLRAAAMRR